ncbi:MAG: arylesterase [Methylococcales bacterium]|nr:arylesterase [Methylococcales bacterium]
MNKILILFITLALSACEKNSPVFDKIADDAVILAFGDSLTYGTGSSQDADYPAILSTLSTHEVINAGIPGEISQSGRRRLPALLDQYQPELLILIHGGNDILRKMPKQQTADNLAHMINEAKQRNIKVIMLGVPKPGLFLMDSAEFYQQVAESHKVPIDLDTLPNILGSSDLKSDTIHPNNQGYQLMAEKIFNLLLKTGAL